VDKTLATYEAPSVDLADRDLQQDAHGIYHYTVIVPFFLVGAAALACFARPGLQHTHVYNYDWLGLFKRVQCWTNP
jgi:hypothetical protein